MSANTDGAQQLLSAYETQIRERRAERSLRKLKTGRYLLFLIALLNIIPYVARYGDQLMAHLPELYFAAGISSFYFLMFFVSRYKPFISFLLASPAYLIVNIFSLKFVLQHKNQFEIFDISPSFFPIVLFITIAIKLIALFYLVNSATNAYRYEQLIKFEE